MSDKPSQPSTYPSPDKPKIIAGLALFAVVVAFPIWFAAARTARDRNGDGQPDYRPMPELPEGAQGCVESKEFMRASHMDMLAEWRDAVVRADSYDYVSQKDGQHWQRSLSKTCMSCHVSQQKFCGECHDYLGVEPDCWHCHVEPEKAGASGEPPALGGLLEGAPDDPGRGRK
jgi:hypothetical protein